MVVNSSLDMIFLIPICLHSTILVLCTVDDTEQIVFLHLRITYVLINIYQHDLLSCLLVSGLLQEGCCCSAHLEMGRLCW